MTNLLGLELNLIHFYQNVSACTQFDWRGNTTFTLQNGQVWQQNDSSELYASKLINPKVRVVFSGFSG